MGLGTHLPGDVAPFWFRRQGFVAGPVGAICLVRLLINPGGSPILWRAATLARAFYRTRNAEEVW
jgi:hypothetical protein